MKNEKRITLEEIDERLSDLDKVLIELDKDFLRLLDKKELIELCIDKQREILYLRKELELK